MAINGMISLCEILDKALQGTEIPETAPEMDEKSRAKFERQQQKWREQEQMRAEKKAREEEIRKQRQADMSRLMAERRSQRLEEVLNGTFGDKRNNNRKVSYQDTVKEIPEWKKRQEEREKEIQSWMVLIDKLVDADLCSADDQNTIELEKFVRDFPGTDRFCFCGGLPVRPSFLMPDKNDKSVKYRVWKKISPETVILEFGSQVPWKRDKDGNKYQEEGKDPVRFFSIKYYDRDEQKIKPSMLVYERNENEFEPMRQKLVEFFQYVVPESRKKFQALRDFMDKKVGGFNHRKLDNEVHALFNEFLRQGGKTENSSTVKLEPNQCAIFNPEAKYMLVNLSYKRSGVINPESCLNDKVPGFAKQDDKIICTIAPHMAIIEFLHGNITFVYGSR